MQLRAGLRSSEGATCGRSLSRDAGHRGDWTRTSCGIYTMYSIMHSPPDRPTCFSSMWTRLNQAIQQGDSEERRAGKFVRLRQPSKPKPLTSCEVGKSASPFFLRPGNLTGRVVLTAQRETVGEVVPEHRTTAPRVLQIGRRGMGRGIPREGSWVLVPSYLQFRCKESSRSQRFQDPFPVGPPAESKFK